MKLTRSPLSVVGLIAVITVSAVAWRSTLAQQGQRTDPKGSPQVNALHRLNSLRSQLKDSHGKERKDLIASVEKACDEYFHLDLEHRRAELDRLKQRANETKALIEKRISSKTELIDLQLKSFQYEADGLELFVDQRDFPKQGNDPMWNHYAAQGGNGARDMAASAGPKVAHAQSKQSQAQQRFQELAQGTAPGQNRKTVIQRINEAREMLRAAEGANDEKKATEEMKAALAEYFDLDIESRRAAIESVLEKLKSMESRLEKRANAKASIVELQVQMFVNEADGLGFFSETDATSGNKGIGLFGRRTDEQDRQSNPFEGPKGGR